MTSPWQRLQARITLFHAAKPLHTSLAKTYGFYDSATLEAIEEKMLEKAEFQLSLYAEKIVETRLDFDMLVHPGNAFLLGSTSNYVLHHCPCAVRVIPYHSANQQ